ncbi:hypothetical protein [Candidatus Neptunichlamydia sp. REUL1]|uniref:hypothetical protein n=1 Tax=Candidatus Neptunichlamydia sp. REUL1 TaxID=3064277 RepID=UPI0029302E31|nr:hypothetical protein [Candidatus Neptunochlamydia sp. REUL1]
MKVFSLLSTAVVTTCLTASGFCKDARISQNQTYGSSRQSKNMDDPNQMTHSVHGCMSGFSIEAEFI